jgi:hypothetical protein
MLKKRLPHEIKQKLVFGYGEHPFAYAAAKEDYFHGLPPLTASSTIAVPLLRRLRARLLSLDSARTRIAGSVPLALNNIQASPNSNRRPSRRLTDRGFKDFTLLLKCCMTGALSSF